jgi:hypothetical protein
MYVCIVGVVAAARLPVLCCKEDLRYCAAITAAACCCDAAYKLHCAPVYVPVLHKQSLKCLRESREQLLSLLTVRYVINYHYIRDLVKY